MYSFVESGIVLQSILFSALDTYFIAPLCILKSILGSLYGFSPSPLFSQTTYNIGIGIPILCKGQSEKRRGAVGGDGNQAEE